MLSLDTNVGGLRAMTAMNQSSLLLNTSTERLSDGIRINRAADDPSGVIVRDRYQAQITGLDQGITNIQSAQGLVQIAESGLDKVVTVLQQMRSLAVRAADDNLNPSERADIQRHIALLVTEINDTAAKTQYNGHNLLDGSITDAQPPRAGSVKLQSQSFLADGSNLLGAPAVLPANGATTIGAISQGSYEVKLVFDANVLGQVDAQIYYSTGNGDVDAVPVSTLTNVGAGSRFYAAGGISFTINTVSTLDVGLTSYVKAYTYVTGNATNQPMMFQAGPDEGQVLRVGLKRMDVATLFRTGLDSYNASDIHVDNALQAQDLIGQIDDALQYTDSENLKVGAYYQSFARMMTLNRAGSSQNSSQLSIINDADMAMEATNQSRRSILVQSGTAMIAQANSSAQFVLQLLR